MSWIDGKSLIQNSDEWHTFRGKHIGASDVPGIMGTCDFKKPIDVFNSKVRGEKFKGNWATERGKRLEPIVLGRFESLYRCSLTSPTLEYKEWPTLSASLDGLWKDSKAIIEVKVPSRIKHIGALCGDIPETYIDQIQTQLIVSGLDICYYASFMEDEPEGFDLALVKIYSDFNRQKEILEKCKRFWEIVKSGVWDESF